MKSFCPAWAKNESVYEITPDTYPTFAAIEQRLSVLKRLGVGILWLVPIHETAV
jgi:glycosidase